jgi:transposase
MKNLKTYSKEFKLDAIALVRGQNYAVVKAPRNLDVSAQALSR